jgi:hypothetical protein
MLCFSAVSTVTKQADAPLFLCQGFNRPVAMAGSRRRYHAVRAHAPCINAA